MRRVGEPLFVMRSGICRMEPSNESFMNAVQSTLIGVWNRQIRITSKRFRVSHTLEVMFQHETPERRCFGRYTLKKQ